MIKAKLPAVIEQRRLQSPAITPQALVWNDGVLWMGSRDLGRIYKIDIDMWRVLEEIEPPGIPWAAVATNGSLCFTLGEGAEDDRYVYESTLDGEFSKMFACPELTGSYLSFDGEHLYLSQWYQHRILKLDAKGNILRKIDIGAEISGHVFADDLVYVLRGTEQDGESWCIARLDPRQETPEVIDVATVPFACRSLTFDGENFWSSHRAANEIVCYALPP